MYVYNPFNSFACHVLCPLQMIWWIVVPFVGFCFFHLLQSQNTFASTISLDDSPCNSSKWNFHVWICHVSDFWLSYQIGLTHLSINKCTYIVKHGFILGREVKRSTVELGELCLDPNVLMLYSFKSRANNLITTSPNTTCPLHYWDFVF